MSLTLDRALAEAILGIDTLWGGDVMNPSGTGRFIADSWFSDEKLPRRATPTPRRRRSAKLVDSRRVRWIVRPSRPISVR